MGAEPAACLRVLALRLPASDDFVEEFERFQKGDGNPAAVGVFFGRVAAYLRAPIVVDWGVRMGN